MRQFAPYGAVYPGAENSTQQGDAYNQEAAADFGVERTRASARYTPTEAEDEPADDIAPTELFFGDDNLLACNGFDFEAFDEQYRYHTNSYGAADNAVHVKTLQAEHLLDAEPRDNLRLYQDNAKYDADEQEFDVLHRRYSLSK